MVLTLSESLHNYDPQMQFGVAPNAVWAEKWQHKDGSDTSSSFSSYYDLYADTKYWVEAGWLDYIAPQVYYETGHEMNDFSILLNWWKDVIFESGEGTKLYIGLADYKVAEAEEHTNPWYNGAELIRQMNACTASSEVDGTIHFRYRFIAENPVLQRIFSSRGQ